MTTVRDLTGQRFGKLTVLKREPKDNPRAFWRCRCDCGQSTVKMGKYLTNGDTGSCGCDQRAMRARGNPKYGDMIAHFDHMREYHIWRGMKSRCYTKSASNYRFYGAKGVTVHEPWRESFQNFYRDMGPCPSNFTLDRIDPFGNYEPANCRWLSWDEQHRNLRRHAALRNGRDDARRPGIASTLA